MSSTHFIIVNVLCPSYYADAIFLGYNHIGTHNGHDYNDFLVDYTKTVY